MMPAELHGERYYTAAEAARYLGISRDTFYKSVRERLSPYHVGVLKRIHYKQSDLDALNEARPVEKQED